MSRKKRKGALEFAKSGGSRVALAARQKSGAGAHGGSSRDKNRRDRRLTKQNLRGTV